MGSSGDGIIEIDNLERGLLLDTEISNGDCEIEEDDEGVLYTASFKEMEEHYVKYQTAQWVIYSLLLVLAWGIGLFMLLYIPVRRYILRKDFRSRKLYVTPNAIVYKVTRPVPFPCLGVLKKEKHVLLPSVADVIIEQGYLQSLYGVYSVRIENVGVIKPPSDDVKIQGIANAREFRNVVLSRLSSMRSESYSRQVSRDDLRPSYSHAQWTPSFKSIGHGSREVILQKLDEVGSSMKRVENLIEEQYCQTAEPVN